MSDSTVGFVNQHGLDLWLSCTSTTRVSAKVSEIPGDIRLSLGDGFGQGVQVIFPYRIADQVVDALVDALEAARAAEYQKIANAEENAHDEAI